MSRTIKLDIEVADNEWTETIVPKSMFETMLISRAATEQYTRLSWFDHGRLCSIKCQQDPATILALINGVGDTDREAYAKEVRERLAESCRSDKDDVPDLCCACCGKPFTAGMSCGECGVRVDYKALNSLMDQLNSWKVAAVALADAVAESGDDVNDINVHKAFDNVRRLETGKTPQSAVKQAAPDVALLEAAEWILDRFNTNGLLYQSEIDTFTEHFNTIKAARAAVEGKSC